MASDPTMEDIQYFMEVTQADRALAIKFLKRYQSQDNAVNAWFENNGRLVEETTPWVDLSGWDENQFHSGRTYGPENNPGNSFQVHAQDNVDTLGPGVFGNLSRPNSRADDRVNMNEDTDMQEAISASMGQTIQGQESGVVENKGFRPAERSYYDPHKWSMTLSKPIMPNSEPRYRRRAAGAPAFMKPSLQGNYVPALLTILQEIPMAKEALLARDALLLDYGIGEDWWDGEPMRVRRVVAADDETQHMQDAFLVAECQRIMAFLELTDRAYGNVSVLGQLSEAGSNDSNGNDTVEGTLLDEWQAQILRVLPKYELSQTFRNHARSENHQSPETEGDNHEFSVVRLYGQQAYQVASTDIVNKSPTLYDALDGALWGTWAPENPQSMYLEFGQVVIFVLDHNSPSQTDSGTAVEVPSTLYVDRYLQENIPKARDRLQKQYGLAEQVKQANKAQEKFKFIPHPSRSNESIDPKDLLRVVKPFFAGTGLSGDEDADSDIVSGKAYHDLEANEKISDTLQTVADRVMTKYQVLEDQKEKLIREIREVLDFFKEPTEEDETCPVHPYTLHGVATDATTTYVLADPNTTEDLIDTNLEDWQWWRISYSMEETQQPIEYENVDEDRVLAAIKNPETKRVMLVYASNEATSYTKQELPGPLRNFVRADNLNFNHELQQTRRYPSPSSKRKTDEEWDNYVKPQTEPNWGGANSPDSITAQADDDTDNPPPLVHASSENSPPPYSRYPSEQPPPVPPRTVASKRPAPSSSFDSKDATTQMIEDVSAEPAVGADFKSGDGFTDIDLLGIEEHEMRDMHAAPHGLAGAPVFGTGGAGEDAQGSYASSIRMSDVEEEKKGEEDLMEM